MLKIKYYDDKLNIIFSGKKEINLDELNCIASDEIDCLEKVKYRQENGKHILSYEFDKKYALSEQIRNFTHEELGYLLKSIQSLDGILKKQQMLLSNVLLEPNYVQIKNEHYKYIYMPVLDCNNVSLKASLLKIANSIKSKDVMITEYAKRLKKAKTDEEASAYTAEYIKEVLPVNGNIMMTAESETTLLSEESVMQVTMEGETTLLSEEPVMQMAVEGETTILSEDNSCIGITEIIQNQFSESETTLFSAEPNVGVKEVGAESGNYTDLSLSIIDNRTGRKETVNKNIFLIGKDTNNMDFVIDDISVSRHHATILCENGSYFIMDNKSTNGTSMEGVTLSPFEKAELYDGSIISLGNVGLQIKIEGR